jgi:phosphoglycolate phosphatase-like HAD superfamily hydrolase
MPQGRRLVLFDIDGTLLSGAGAGRRAVEKALADLALPHEHISRWSFGGKTDPQIGREVLGHLGLAPEAIAAHLPRFLERYLHHLESEFPSNAACHLKPGVRPLLEALAERGQVLTGLLTGNLEPGARIKLAHFDLLSFFHLGAYGSDHADRPELPAIAVARAEEHTGYRYRGKEIVIIGDTEHDIRCGASLGVRAIGVATGSYSQAELSPHGADYLFEDLADTERVLDAILGE